MTERRIKLAPPRNQGAGLGELGVMGDTLPKTDGASEDRPRLLIADDDREMLALLSSTFIHAGYEVVESANGTEVLNLLRASTADNGRLDLAVLDINMPGLSGLQILGWIRRSSATMPVILITAFGSPQLHEHAQRLGATKVFDKPFSLMDLLDFVGTALASPAPSGRGLG